MLPVLDDIGRVVVQHCRRQRTLGVLNESQYVDRGIFKDSANGRAVLIRRVVDRSTEVERVGPGGAGQASGNAGAGFGAKFGERDAEVGCDVAGERGLTTGNTNDPDPATIRHSPCRAEAFESSDQLIVIAGGRNVMVGEEASIGLTGLIMAPV